MCEHELIKKPAIKVKLNISFFFKKIENCFFILIQFEC